MYMYMRTLCLPGAEQLGAPALAPHPEENKPDGQQLRHDAHNPQELQIIQKKFRIN